MVDDTHSGRKYLHRADLFGNQIMILYEVKKQVILIGSAPQHEHLSLVESKPRISKHVDKLGLHFHVGLLFEMGFGYIYPMFIWNCI